MSHRQEAGAAVVAAGNSERRRRQNAAAQRNYRAKQKQRVQRLERLIAVALADGGVQPNPSLDLSSTYTGPEQLEKTGGGEQQPSAMALDLYRGGEATTLDSSLTVLDFLDFLRHCTPREIETCGIILEREGFGPSDVIKFGLISMGYTLDPALFSMARTMPFRPWLQLLRRSVGANFDFRRASWSGFKLLSTFSVPATLSPAYTITHCPDPMPDLYSLATLASIEPRIPCPALSLSANITMTRITVAAAMTANAAHLSISPLAVLDDESISPFYGASPASLPQHISPDLMPTPAQLFVPHHPCFDLIPWPEFRELALRAVSADPPVFDEEDLCLDVLNDGLLCWGGTAAGGASSLHGRGQGSPWDGRSWEAAPWFLAKYAVITGGPRGEMWRNSEWWRAIRGEGI